MRHSTTVEDALRVLQEAAAAQRGPPEPSPLGAFRVICAVVCAVIAFVFLSINTLMLGRFGFKQGADEIEQWAQAIIAGTIPWALALLPFILLSTWVPGHWHTDRRGRTKWRRGRPGLATVGACALYAVLVGVNFVGGIGVMATARQHVAGKAHDAAGEEVRLNESRGRLSKELDGIGKHRPADEVAALISRQQQHQFWRATGNCKDQLSSRAHTRYCAEYDVLQAELARARKGTEIRQQLTLVDAQLANPIRTEMIAADAQNIVLARNLGMDVQRVRDLLPLMWPVLLELGSMLMAYFSLKLFRISHRSLVDVPVSHYTPPARQLTAEPSQIRRVLEVLPNPPTGTRGSLDGEDPVRQRAAYDAFWSLRMRRTESGQVAEGVIYEHYQTFCAQRSVAPFDLPTFRKYSSERVPHTTMIGGVTWWCNVAVSDA